MKNPTVSQKVGRFDGVAINIYHSTSLDALARGLAGSISAARLGPFDSELVALGDRGLQRWLDQRLSHYMTNAEGRAAGISAGIDYLHAGSLPELFLPRASAWEPIALAWRILAIVDAGEITGMPLKRGSTSFLQARELANLILAYASQRPAMVRAWLAGQYVADGEKSEDLHPDFHGQVKLMKRLVEEIGAPPSVMDGAGALEVLSEAGAARLNVFGWSYFSPADIEFLRRAGTSVEINLWLASPSPRLWDMGGRGEERSALLDVLGAQSVHVTEALRAGLPGARVTELPHAGQRPDGVLGRLQADIEADRMPSHAGLWDDSIQVHAAHGPSRQVEVLREVLVELFEEDRDLQPRDVLVLVPDMDEYGQLFAAAFDRRHHHPGSNLGVRLAGARSADRNPLADLLLTLLDLVADRTRSTQILDLLHAAPVQRRLGVSDADIETLQEWVKESGIRWGFDAEDRQRFGIHTNYNSVAFGLDRLILGLALDGEELLGEVAPYPAVGSVQIDLLGVFAEFLARLHAGISALSVTGTARSIGNALRDLLSVLAAGEEGEEMHIARVLQEIISYGDTPASISDVRSLIEERTEPLGGFPVLRTGGVTVAPLGMVSGEYDVVCLVGMDDGTFPRPDRLNGDDVRARYPRAGEQSRNAADRQHFLDAVLSATSRVIITYSGAGESRGEERVPATVVAHLMDDLEAITGERRVIRHPLHAFDRKYFTGGELRSYDQRAAHAAKIYHRPQPAMGWEPVRGLPPSPEIVTLAELTAFAADPVRFFFEKQLGVYLDDGEATLPTAIPISPDSLEEWNIGQAMLRRSRENEWAPSEHEAEVFSGRIPPGELGRGVLERVNEKVRNLSDAARVHAMGPMESVDAAIAMGESEIGGRIDRIYGNEIVHVSYSTLAPKHVLAAWIPLLALKVTRPEREWSAVVIGRRGENAARKVLSAPDASTAEEILTGALALYAKGRGEPLPLPLKTAYSWVQKVDRKKPADLWRPAAVTAAAKTWTTTSDYGRPNEDQDAYYKLAWGRVMTFEELLGIQAHPEEQQQGETSRFACLAQTLLEGMVRGGG